MEQNKTRVWPMVLVISIVCGLVGIGGCTSLACATMALNDISGYVDYGYNDVYDYSYEPDYWYDDDWYDNYDYYDGYGYDYDLDHPYGYGYGDNADSYTYDFDIDPTESVWTEDDFMEVFGTTPGENTIGEGDVVNAGMYYVDADVRTPSLPKGMYMLHGASNEVNRYTVFDVNNDGTFTYEYSVVYFGTYFADLEDEQLVVFEPAADVTMEPAAKAPLNTGFPENPLSSGCYRVGIDIPAGTYTVTIQRDALEAAVAAETQPGAFIMDNLDFEDDSVVSSYYLNPSVSNDSCKVTVRDGQYLELYAAQATQSTVSDSDGSGSGNGRSYGYIDSHGDHHVDTRHPYTEV